MAVAAVQAGPEPRLDAGTLRARAAAAREALRGCGLCPRRCGADRLAGETGFCAAGEAARVHHS